MIYLLAILIAAITVLLMYMTDRTGDLRLVWGVVACMATITLLVFTELVKGG